MTPKHAMPTNGKLIVLAPAQAALAVEQRPEIADRIWTSPHVGAATALVVDLDELVPTFLRTESVRPS